MSSFPSLRYLSTLLVGACLALPITGSAKDKHDDHDHHGGGDHHRGNYSHGDYYRHGGSYYGSGYSRSHYGYARPYYGYGYGPSVGISYYSEPSYAYETTRVYRGHSSSDASDDLAVDVQRALKRRGYYTGPVDGDIGPGSRSAIRSYQADRRLSVTGRIDSSLLRALGIG